MKVRLIWIGLVVVVVVAAAGAGYTFYFSKNVNPQHVAAGPALSCSTPVPTDGLRTFQIVPNQSTASYKVHENLIVRNLPSTDAIGKTQDVSGTFRIRTAQTPLVAALNATVNLSTLQTDEPRRDRFVRNDELETKTYPHATFASFCAQDLPTSYSDGQQISFKLLGNMTMHGKTNQATFAVTGKLSGDTVTGTATTTIFMTDFGIPPPNLANIAIAENKVEVTLEFTAKEG